MTTRKIGRNDPCPCGSGKKFKNCCLEKSAAKTGTEERIRLRLVQEILAFARKRLEEGVSDAFEFFWDDLDPTQFLDDEQLAMAEINFFEWLVHDWRPDDLDEKSLIDIFIENSKRLKPDEKAILIKMNDSVLSLYEVQEVFPEQGLSLRDLLLGDEYDVKEKLATRSVRKWDVFAARILSIDNRYIMTGSVYPLLMRHKKETIDHLKACFRDFKSDTPNASMRDFLKLNGDIFNLYWCEYFRSPSMPTLVTTTGEPVLFAKAIFEMSDQALVASKLTQIDELTEDENGVFLWLARTGDESDSTVLGTVVIKDDKLLLECNSKSRLEKGKSLLTEHLDDLLTHTIDTLQSPYQAMKDLPEIDSEDEVKEELPLETQQQFYDQFMRKHYEGWLNQKIPALGNKSPLETVKRPWGKQKVEELLMTIENMEAHKKRQGAPFFDIGWLWERLNIKR